MNTKHILAIALIAFGFTVSAQCVPDQQYINAPSGIYPDSLPEAWEGQAYQTTITIKTICDTSVTFQNIPVQLSIKAFKILDVLGEPDGFLFTPDQPQWNNPTPCAPIMGCVLVQASQAAVDSAVGGGPLLNGVYPLTVYVDILATGNPIPSTPTWVSTLGTPPYGSAIAYNDYFLKINPLNFTIETAPTDRFWVAPNFPNPFTGVTTMRYNTVKEETITLKVFNMLGGLVAENKYRSQKGTNTLEFDAAKLSGGMYIYTISNGTETVTRKMTVN